MWFVIIILVSQCSCSKQSLRIYGGIDAKSDEYPYVVRIELQRHLNRKNKSISYENFHLCTAAALSSVWVLSASHCIHNLDEHFYGHPYSVEKLVIRHGHVEHLPGIHDSFSDVLLTVLHPLFSLPYPIHGSLGMVKHDIGLLKTYPMNIKSYVKLSAVDYKCFYGQKAIMAGFGIMATTIKEKIIGIADTLLLKKPLQILQVLITKCNQAETKVLGLCIASRCGHTTLTCGGDSGGPVLHSSGVIGVLSMGPMSGYCLDPRKKETVNIAGLIIPVTPYIEWIYNITKN